MKNDVLNDGWALIYKEKPKKTDFSAKENVKGVSDMEYICRLAYKEKSRRQQDVEFAERQDRSLSLKLECWEDRRIQRNFKVLIKNIIYDVIYVDFSRSEKKMFLYLEEVRKNAN